MNDPLLNGAGKERWNEASDHGVNQTDEAREAMPLRPASAGSLPRAFECFGSSRWRHLAETGQAKKRRDGRTSEEARSESARPALLRNRAGALAGTLITALGCGISSPEQGGSFHIGKLR